MKNGDNLVILNTPQSRDGARLRSPAPSFHDIGYLVLQSSTVLQTEFLMPNSWRRRTVLELLVCTDTISPHSCVHSHKNQVEETAVPIIQVGKLRLGRFSSLIPIRVSKAALDITSVFLASKS